ncbi:MAG: hypothetical protein IT378_24550 [Sandaracinaceae bacterium]|nr:hypothetical protein [Sandaracinaceae bacterium]
MELLGVLFTCSLTMLPFALVFGIFGWQIYAHRRDTRRWLESAAQLGLSVEPYDASRHREHIFAGSPSFRQVMHGVRGGVPVTVGIRVVITGSGKNRRKHYYTYAQANFPSSLGLGLSVRPVGIVGSFFQALAGASDLAVGHPEVDRLYDIHAVEARAAAQILTTPYVGEALVGLAGRQFKPEISDGVVRCETTGRVTDAAQLAIALDSAIELARRVASARSATTTELDQALGTAWRLVAGSRNFEFDRASARIAGRLEGVAIEARVETRPAGRFTVFEARFDRPLGVGLQISKQGSLTKIASFFGWQDIEVGDPFFDGRFVVKGQPVERVKALLTPEVRAHLVSLQDQVAQLVVKDDRLTAEVAWLIVEPEWVEGGLVAVARAAAALAQVHMPSAGPFRG